MFDFGKMGRQLLDHYRGVPFTLVDWEGQRRVLGAGEPQFTIHFKTRDALVRSLVETTLGFGEGYARGDVVIEGDLEEVLTALGQSSLATARESFLAGWARKLWPRTLHRQKHDIEHHYGLGNEFYEFYLDKYLQYSCAYFRTPEDSLDLAQEQKIAYTTAKLDLRPGQRLLDIGCGWGHLMFHAAETYGVECLGITLCDNQATYIRQEAAARGLPVEVRVMNYLELPEDEKWHRLVSVGMMCHVGERYANRYFDKVKSLMAPGGICLLHCIAKMKEASGTDPFVEKHVFPGYWFFSLEGMTRRAVERGFNVLDVENLRRHYALTAHHWRANFLRHYDAIKAKMGFGDTFMRIWEFYLASVVMGFRIGHMNLIQMVMSNGINDDYPWTREFLFAPGRLPALVET